MKFRFEKRKNGGSRPPLSELVVWAFCLGVIFTGPVMSQEGSGPKIDVSQEMWDFGTIRRGEEVTCPLVIANMGKGTLHITQVRSSCTTCSVVKGYKERLGPGESTDVKVTFRAEGRKGRITKTIYIDSNDPDQPRTVFRVTGIVEKSEAPEIVVDPNPWYPDSITTDPRSGGELLITNDGLTDLIVKKMEAAGCVVKETSIPAIGPGDSAVVHVSFNLKSMVWEGERYVMFHSNDPYQRELKVKIRGDVVSTGSQDTTRVCSLIFLSKDCTECAYVMSQVVAPLQKMYPGLQIRTIAVDDPHNYNLLTNLEKKYKDTSNEIPVLFIDTFVLGGRKEIERDLVGRITGCIEKGGCAFPEYDEEKPSGRKSVKKPIYMAYFYQPGCKQCDRVNHMLKSLRKRYEKLHIKEFNIGTIENKLLNESIGELLKVPDKKRLLTPALVVGDQYFVQHDITDQRVQSAVEGFRDTGSMCSWDEAKDLQAEAKMSIIERFKAFGPITVLLGGLVDGVNPCAFATIIFFISYLTYIGRKGKDLLYVGLAFTVAVFMTYLLVGFGIFNFIQSLKIFDVVSMIIYVVTAALAFILGTYSVYDMLKIRRGRVSEITLQLPNFLKKRIHKTIRKRARMRRYVLAAFITGWIVSLLELFCTGQVYLPTIAFVTGVPELRLHAFYYLVLYNLMFVLPLCIVFGLTYYGTTSEQIAGWMKRHIIAMKAALAMFFFCLGGFLLSVIF
ncbi:MAG: DUF1573 domain-containing protein [Gemmatimonadota bacterium]|nr:MAG: DUF1573 domain-containing protein [Gemmatimonadota bacterium]